MHFIKSITVWRIAFKGIKEETEARGEPIALGWDVQKGAKTSFLLHTENARLKYKMLNFLTRVPW